MVSGGEEVNGVWPEESWYYFGLGNVEMFLCFVKNDDGLCMNCV